jgi:hypothetical protein
VDGNTPLHLASKNGELDGAVILIDHGADLLAKDNKGKTTLDVTRTKRLAEQLSHKFLKLTNAVPAAAVIQDKLKVLIHENKQQQSEITDLQDKLQSTTVDLREQHKVKIADIQDKLQSTTVALSGQQMDNEAIQESRKPEITALSEQHIMELAAITEDRKVELNALSKQNKMEIAAITKDRKLEMNALSDSPRKIKRKLRLSRKTGS